MIKKVTFLAVLFFVGTMTLAQQGTDIYLFSFKIDQNQFALSNARNITNSPGYDNQPFFLPDGESLLYSSDDGFGQTDIYRYNISARSERRLTFTPNSEYSPTITPDGKYFSCIILEKNEDQYLWQYPLNGAVPRRLSKTQPIGYHCWVNPELVSVLIVGEPNTLNFIDLKNDKVEEIVKSPGVTFRMIPNSTNKMSYIDESDEHNWFVKNLDVESKTSVDIIKTIKKFPYFTWTPNGILISGDGKRIYKFDPSQDTNWVELANLSDYGIKDFTRLTVSPKGDLLAVVVTE